MKIFTPKMFGKYIIVLVTFYFTTFQTNAQIDSLFTHISIIY